MQLGGGKGRARKPELSGLVQPVCYLVPIWVADGSELLG